MATLTTEQIRSIFATRMEEFSAYQYMDQILEKVQQSEQAVKDAKKDVAKLDRDIQTRQEMLEALERKADVRKGQIEE